MRKNKFMPSSFLASFLYPHTIQGPKPGKDYVHFLDESPKSAKAIQTALHKQAHRPTQSRQSFTETSSPVEYRFC